MCLPEPKAQSFTEENILDGLKDTHRTLGETWMKVAMRVELKPSNDSPVKIDYNTGKIGFNGSDGDTFESLQNFFKTELLEKAPWNICRILSCKGIITSSYQTIKQFNSMLERIDPASPLAIEVCMDFEYIPRSFKLDCKMSPVTVNQDKSITFFLRIYSKDTPFDRRPYILLPIICSAVPGKIKTRASLIYPSSAASEIERLLFTVEPDSLVKVIEKIYALDEIKALLTPRAIKVNE